jgi:hypothetical protein
MQDDEYTIKTKILGGLINRKTIADASGRVIKKQLRVGSCRRIASYGEQSKITTHSLTERGRLFTRTRLENSSGSVKTVTMALKGRLRFVDTQKKRGTAAAKPAPMRESPISAPSRRPMTGQIEPSSSADAANYWASTMNRQDLAETISTRANHLSSADPNIDEVRFSMSTFLRSGSTVVTDKLSTLRPWSDVTPPATRAITSEHEPLAAEVARANPWSATRQRVIAQTLDQGAEHPQAKRQWCNRDGIPC